MGCWGVHRGKLFIADESRAWKGSGICISYNHLGWKMPCQTPCNIYSTFAGLNHWATLLRAVTSPSSGWGGGFVRLCRLLQDARPCLRNILFYYLFKGCFHDTAISNPAWWDRKIIAGLFGRTCFIWHILGKSSTKEENKVAMSWALCPLVTTHHK